ncbi:MAG: DUF420 domain-containing protein [Acidobacteriota bacterium]|nr:DUF420 domain-containing protein [Acidobacteriota bacterium]
MNANLAYWLFAYVLMSVTLVIAFRAIRQVKAGKLAAHMKSMVLACNLLLFFVGTYVVKVLVLGREVKEGWSTLDFVILYTHEAFILIMLVSGTLARLFARKFKDRLEHPTREDLANRRKHMLSGKIAVTSATAALGTATLVLWILFKHLPQ